eukprot:scaffold716_cov364-Pinguiococcus_pyrenoidosus.AAC.10
MGLSVIPDGEVETLGMTFSTIDAESSEGCPVPNASGMLRKYRNADVYNVYSQKIDPANQMPAQANQQRAPGQAKQLSTERVSSSIPKVRRNERAAMSCPAPQQFGVACRGSPGQCW